MLSESAPATVLLRDFSFLTLTTSYATRRDLFSIDIPDGSRTRKTTPTPSLATL